MGMSVFHGIYRYSCNKFPFLKFPFFFLKYLFRALNHNEQFLRLFLLTRF